MIITKEQLKKYRKVQHNGETNMWDVSAVGDLSGLDGEVIYYIMKNYTELNKKLLDINVK